MRIVYPKINVSFLLETNRLNNIVIESNRLFEESIIELNEDIQGKSDYFSLSEKSEKLEIKKEVIIINSPLDFEYDRREINKRLYTYLKREIDESDLAQEISEKYYEIKEIIEKLNLLSDISIEYDEMAEYSDIFKHFDIHVKKPTGTFVEKFLEYMDVVHRMLGKRVFVLANCEAYIDLEDLKYLREYAEYNEIYILMLSNKLIGLNSNLNVCIIDSDLCEIH